MSVSPSDYVITTLTTQDRKKTVKAPSLSLSDLKKVAEAPNTHWVYVPDKVKQALRESIQWQKTSLQANLPSSFLDMLPLLENKSDVVSYQQIAKALCSILDKPLQRKHCSSQLTRPVLEKYHQNLLNGNASLSVNTQTGKTSQRCGYSVTNNLLVKKCLKAKNIVAHSLAVQDNATIKGSLVSDSISSNTGNFSNVTISGTLSAPNFTVPDISAITSATALDIPNTLVKRDATGSFAVNTLKSTQVGIGTDSPTEALDVQGNTIINGSITATGPINFSSLSEGLLHTDTLGNVSSSLLATKDINDAAITDNKLASSVSSTGQPNSFVKLDDQGNFSANSIATTTLGIGTHMPNAALDVQGDALISGALTVGTFNVSTLNAPNISTPGNITSSAGDIQALQGSISGASLISSGPLTAGAATLGNTTTQGLTNTGTFSSTGPLNFNSLPQGLVHTDALGGVSSSLLTTADINDGVITDTKLASPVSSTGQANSFVKLDGQGDFSAHTITANLLGNATTATLAAQVSGQTPLSNGDSVVQRDSNGDFAAGTITASLSGNATTATTAATATDFTGTLSGEVAGPQSNTHVVSVAGVTAQLLASGATLANAATETNTFETLVKRDLNGNFSASLISADLAGNADTATTATTVSGQTPANNPGTVVQRDADGNFSANIISASLQGNADTATNFTGLLSGDVTGTQSASVVSFVGGLPTSSIVTVVNLANSATPTNGFGTLVQRDNNGDFEAGTITANLAGTATTAVTAANFSGTLSGDVTGTQNNTQVALVGDKTAATVASAVTQVQAASSLSEPGTLVIRDSNGNFSANIISANLTGNVTGTASGSVNKLGDSMSGPLSIVSSSGTALTVTGAPATPAIRVIPEGNSKGIVIESTLDNALEINVNKFTISGSTGNTAIAGTLAVGGNTQLNLSSGIVHADSTGILSSSPIVNADIGANAAIEYGKLNLIGSITDADINTNAAISDTKLAQIVTPGKVALSATNGTADNLANTLVARDGSGNFTAGTITANVVGTITGSGNLTTLNAGNTTITGPLTLSGATSTLSVDGATQFNNSVFFAQDIPGIAQNTLIVTKGPLSGPNEFNSINAALASITDNSAANRYAIVVGPGIYSETTIQLKAYVSIRGEALNACIIQAANANQDLIIGTPNASLEKLTFTGATGPGNAAIVFNGGGFLDIVRCNFLSNTTHIRQDSLEGFSVVSLNSCTIDPFSNFSTGFQVSNTGTNTFSILGLYSVNWVALANSYSPTFDLVNLNGVGAVCLGSGIFAGSAVAGLGGNAFVVRNGAAIQIDGMTLTAFDKALYLTDEGVGPHLHVIGAYVSGNTTNIQIDHPAATGSVSGVVDRSKIDIIAGAKISLLLSDPVDPATVEIGPIIAGNSIATQTNIAPQIFYGSNTGTQSGGEVIAINGTTVTFSAGTGYLMVQNATTTDLKYVVFPQQDITLPLNQTNYIFVTKDGVITYSQARPSSISTIILGIITTNTTTVDYIQHTKRQGDHTATLLDTSWRQAIGNLYISGSIVTENSITPLQLDVTPGRYYYSTHEYLPTGGTAVTWTPYYHNGTDGFTTGTPTNTLDGNYDNNTGTLAPIPSGQFARHSLYIVANGNPDGTDHYLFVYAQTTYNTLIEAENGSIPNPPSTFTSNIALIASIIVTNDPINGIELAAIPQEQPRLTFKASSVSGVTNHGDLTGLLNDDHPQYLLVTGARSMIGNLDLGANDITNVGLINNIDLNTLSTRLVPTGADPLPTGAPVTIDTTNQPGIANSFSRSDHQHAHGNQPGGTLHALATTTTAGFMSAADKANLDAINPASFVQKSGDTMTGELIISPSAGTALLVNGQAGAPALAVNPEATSTGLAIGTTSGNALLVNTDKFIVQGSTGNTTIAGTLSVAGGTALTSLGATSPGLVHAASGTGVLTSSLLVDADITPGTIADNKLSSLVESTNVPSSLVKRDGSGSFLANTITANSFNGPLTGNASSATNFTGTLAGDVTGTQTATVVSSVGNQSAASISNAATIVNAATASNTAGTLVLRDGFNNFSAGTITANLIGNVTGNTSGAAALNVLKSGDAMTGPLSITTTAAGITPLTLTPEATSPGLSIGATSGNALNINNGKFTVIGSTGNTTIGGTLNVTGSTTLTGATAITALGATSPGVVHAAGTTGALSSSLIVNGDITTGTISDSKLSSLVSSASIGDSFVKRDLAGSFAGNSITANSFNGPLTGNASSATNFSGSLSGDVTGTQGATAVSLVGGQTAANVATATIAANNATTSNTGGRLVLRDGSGNFSAGTVFANLTGNVTGNLTGNTSGSAALNVLKSGDAMTGPLSITTTAAGITPLTLTPEATSPGLSISATSGNALNINNGKFTVVGSTGNTTIGGTLNVTGTTTLGGATAITALGATSPGVVHAAGTTGALSSSLIVNGDIATGTISDSKLSSPVSSASIGDSFVKRDIAGSFAGNIITANSFSGPLNGNASSATSFTGALAGDVTGTQAATVVSLVGGQTAPNVATATVAANGATAANTGGRLVLRDGSGNFSAGTVFANLVGNVTGSVSFSDGTITAPSITFANQTNTGFYRAAANTIGVSANGINRMTIDSAGVRFVANYKASAYVTSDITPVAAPYTVAFGTKNFDPNNNFVTSGTPASSIYTAPVAGYYLIAAQLTAQAAGTNLSSLRVLKNNALVPGYSVSATIASNRLGSLSLTNIIFLNANETVSISYSGTVGDIIKARDSNIAISLLSI